MTVFPAISVFLLLKTVIASLDNTSLPLGYQVTWLTAKETYDTSFAEIVITPEISNNGTASLYCWSSVGDFASATRPTFYIELGQPPIVNYTNGVVPTGNTSHYFFGQGGYGGQAGTFSNVMPGTYYIGFFANCPYESCISSIQATLACYALDQTGAPIPPSLINNRRTAGYSVGKNNWVNFEIAVTPEMQKGGANGMFLLYLRLSITDYFSTSKLVIYVMQGSLPGIQPTQYNYIYPIGAPVEGSYLSSPFTLANGTYYVGVFGADMALFETSAQFYLKAGFNAAPLNFASSLDTNILVLFSLVIISCLLSGW